MKPKFTKYERAINDIEYVSRSGFYFNPKGKINEHYFAKDLKYLKELNARYEYLTKLFVDMGFCNFCPKYPMCWKTGLKCRQMLERMMEDHCERVMKDE